MNGVKATYVHHVPGRLRVKVPGLDRRPGRGSEVEAAITGLPGVGSVAVNLKSCSVIVHYDAGVVTPEAVLERLKVGGFMDFSRPARGASPVEGVAALVGAAAGRALFGAVLKSGLERSVAGLVAAAIR